MYRGVPGYFGADLEEIVEKVILQSDSIFDIDIGEKICLNMSEFGIFSSFSLLFFSPSTFRRNGYLYRETT